MLDSARRRPLLYAIAIFGLAPVYGPAQHVHGVVELGVVVEDNTVAVSLSAPLSDVVGFEHAPENDEQLELIRQTAATLANPDAMFGLAESASCTISDTSIEGPAYVLLHLAEDDAGSAESHDDHHDAHGGESDNDEHEESAADDHDEHEESAEHEHDDAEQHAEVNAIYEWECGSASDLDSLALRFTESFADVETIEIQILTSAGAQVLTLEGRAPSVSLARP